MGFVRKNSSASTTSTSSLQNANVIWHNVGIPCPPSTVEDALLQANYAAFYQSDTYNEISAVAADFPVARPTLDPSSSEYIGHSRPSISGSINQTSSHHTHVRSMSDAGCECPAFERAELPPRSKSDAGIVTETEAPFDLSTPWNPTFPPYSKFYKPAAKRAPIEEEDETEQDDGSGVGRPKVWEGKTYRVSELIDPFDLVRDEQRDRFGSFSSVSSSSYGSSNSSRNGSFSRSRSSSPASSASNSRNGSRKPSLAETINLKPLPPVLESPSGALFSASEYAAHPNRPLAIRERQEHIRAAIENLDAQTRQARSESRKGSADSAMDVEWKTGFGFDGRKGSKSSTASSSGGTAYGGFGVDNRPAPPKTLEQMRIAEGKKAYEEKSMRKEKGERSWGLSALRSKK